MTSETLRNPHTDQLLTPDNSALIIIDYQPLQVSSIRSMSRDELVFNITSVAKAAVNYNLPIIHSTVNVGTGRNKPPIQQLQDVLGHLPTYDRTSINSWEDTEFKQAVKALGRRKLIMTALWTEACLTFPVLDAIQEGYEVYVPIDAVGGTSPAAHEAALRRIEQAGAKLISRVQMYCELQRDWAREVSRALWAFLKTSTALTWRKPFKRHRRLKVALADAAVTFIRDRASGPGRSNVPRSQSPEALNRLAVRWRSFP